jgi:hypothetical protein
MFPGVPMWWHFSPETLQEKLRAAEEVLLTRGLPWLDTFTPGNVPEWRDLVDWKITGTMMELGFTLVREGAWNLPDFAEYGATAGRINVDLRVPGYVTVECIRYREGRPTLDITRSPPFAYESPSLLATALDEVHRYLQSHIPSWLEGSQQ